jgi:hypothetical protein
VIVAVTVAVTVLVLLLVMIEMAPVLEWHQQIRHH